MSWVDVLGSFASAAWARDISFESPISQAGCSAFCGAAIEARNQSGVSPGFWLEQLSGCQPIVDFTGNSENASCQCHWCQRLHSSCVESDCLRVDRPPRFSPLGLRTCSACLRLSKRLTLVELSEKSSGNSMKSYVLGCCPLDLQCSIVV